jgi:hypothetical protein
MAKTRPSRIKYVLAHGFRISTWGGVLALTGVVVQECRPDQGVFAGWPFIIWFVLAIAAAIPLGFVLGAIFSPFVCMIGEMVNGAPFEPGDTVRILLGRHKDGVARVYEVWYERHQVRMELGPQEQHRVTDVFSWNEVCREKATQA